jgi:hypothetical protein
MRVITYILTTCIFILTTYIRWWHKVYRVTLLLVRACHETRCVGHWTTRANRRWGGLNTQGGFGKLGRMLLPYGGRLSHTGLSHREDHPNVHLGAAPYMRVGLRRWRHCYGLRPRGMRPWSSACDMSRPFSPPWEYHIRALVLSSLHLQMEVVHRLLVVHLHVWLQLCKLLIFNQCYGLYMHID